MEELLFLNDARRKAYTAKVKALGPIGYWPLDDGAGAIQARNLSGTVGNLVYNGDFELPVELYGWIQNEPDGAITWEGAVVHGGGKAAKLVCGASGNTFLEQFVNVTAGRAYTLRFWTRGDGTRGGAHDIADVTHNQVIGASRIATGVTGAEYAEVTRTFAVPEGCKQIRLWLYCPAFNGAFCYFDDVSITDVGPSGPAKNATFGQAGIGDRLTAASFAGNAAIDIFSGVYCGALDGDEGTVSLWLCVSADGDWTDGALRVAFEVKTSDALCGFHIAKDAGNNTLQFARAVAPNTLCNWEGQTGTNWRHCVLAWSRSAGKVWGALSGVEALEQGIGGAFAGCLATDRQAIGAFSPTGGVLPWKGKIAHVAVFNRCLGLAARRALSRK